MKYNFRNTSTFAKSLVILSLLSLSIVSCKKKDSTPATPPATNNNNTNNNNNNSTPYAVFLSMKQTLVSYTVNNLNNFSTAYLSSSPLVHNDPVSGTLLDMGNVTLNGTIFKKNALGLANMYEDTTTSNTYSIPHNWVVSGSNSVPSFSYSNNTQYPVYSGYNAIPDSFVISQGINITLNNYSGADEVETYFSSSSPNANTTVQHVTGQPTSLSFTASDLNTIGLNSNIALVITFYKNNIQTINGKGYNFRTGYSLLKSGIKFK